MCGGQESSGIEIECSWIVHGCFMERGDSVLNVFCCELLQLRLQNKQEVLWLAN